MHITDTSLATYVAARTHVCPTNLLINLEIEVHNRPHKEQMKLYIIFWPKAIWSECRPKSNLHMLHHHLHERLMV
jgi:hypothetical protein